MARERPRHCKRGHEFTSKNTYVFPDGRRACRICRDAAVKRWSATNRPAKRRTPLERFMAKIEIQPSGCWTWTAALHPGGYGVFGHGRKSDGKMAMVLAHRWSYQHFVGPIPGGLEIDHLCRNRACVNPEHLEAVTRQVNQLRGESVSGDASRRTHCPRGHLLDGVRANGHRYCMTCNRSRSREAQRQRRERERGSPSH